MFSNIDNLPLGKTLGVKFPGSGKSRRSSIHIMLAKGPGIRKPKEEDEEDTLSSSPSGKLPGMKLGTGGKY